MTTAREELEAWMRERVKQEASSWPLQEGGRLLAAALAEARAEGYEAAKDKALVQCKEAVIEGKVD